MSSFIPTPEQDKALTHPAPLLVLAGAGTGKTTVLTHRMAEVIASGRARADQVLALTFTDKAATEMAERLGTVLSERGLDAGAREVAALTFHAFGGLVIRENLLRLGFDRAPAVLSHAAAWQLMTAIFDKMTFDAVELTTGSIGQIFDRLLRFIGDCKDHLVGPDELEAHAAGMDLAGLAAPALERQSQQLGELRDLAAAYRLFEEAKREKGLIDFGDLLLLPAKLLATQPTIRDAYRRRFPFVFVDEYQDTNHAQRKLLLELLDPERPEVMVIGDDDQSIYRWRGAVVQNILRFPQEPIFAPGQVVTVPMTLNRRSFPPILDLANSVIAQVPDRHPKELTYHKDNLEGRATVGRHVAASDREEGRWIARRIKELEPEARGYPGKKRGYGAVVVLCRKRSLFAPIGQALEEAGIPYELIGGTGFYGRWEIRDILSYLRVLASPADDLAMARILTSRRWRLSSRDLYHLGRWVRRQNDDRGREGQRREGEARFGLLDAVLRHQDVDGLSPMAADRLVALRLELERFEGDRQQLSLSDLVARVIDATGYRRELQAMPGFESRVALLNLSKLEELARQFEQGTDETHLASFVELVGYAAESEEEGEVRPVDEETDTVKVMTIHQAKGLEFPIVFIPGLAQKVFPASPKDESDKWWALPWELRGDREHLPIIDLSTVGTEAQLKKALAAKKETEKKLQLDEERRLFYVAITRAQRQLYLSRAHWYGTNSKPKEPSEFWDAVESSGFVEDLGCEDQPAENPNLVQTGGFWNTGEGGRSCSEARQPGSLLLTGVDPAAWIEETAVREGYGRWTVLRAEVDEHLKRLAQAQAVSGEETKVDLSCTGLVEYLRCARGYRYVYVDRLPTRPSWALAFGSEVHRRIEELSRPFTQAGEPPGEEGERAGNDLEEAKDRLEDLAGVEWTPVSMADLMACFRSSVYARRPATYVEYSFHLPLELGTLRGRIDRLDLLPDGRWEVVDFKSGVSTPHVASQYRRQLALYALAVREGRGVPAERIAAHLFFLRDGRDLELTFDESELDRVRAESEDALRAIARGVFPMTSDRTLCERCDYSHLCEV
ncbi:MAG: PD-(D/E)XK nuclease family protein [Chloroflexota bacterium]|nr:MAG: PD-(D/E)XK nuclease family protein [Chloroflexota bacterium]